MKVAIVHDYIKEYGGAERVLEALHEIYPQATVFTTAYLPEFLGPHKERFTNWKIKTSSLQNIPYIEKLISPMRIFTPWVFENWDFRGFDLVLVSATGAYTPNLIVRKTNTLHICYCHTPPRFLYGYPTARNWQNNILGKIAGQFLNHSLRQVDFLSYQRPDYIIANSLEVKQRIWKFYRREATVIYPPVDTRSKFKDQKFPQSGIHDAVVAPPIQSGSQTASGQKSKIKKEYYLAGGRLARSKGIDLAIKAANKLKILLKIFGRGFAGYEEELRELAGPTIEFLGEVSDQELSILYAGAKALIYPAQYEDFGIMPVEAQRCGTPVIALRQGGVKETVIEAHSASSGQGPTGVFFDEEDVESVVKAIKKLSSLKIKGEDCKKNADKFNKERFKKEIVDFISSKMKKSRK